MPALTPAMGRPDITRFNPLIPVVNKDMPSFIGNEEAPYREWGRNHSLYENRWLHSDVKNMAYFYVYNLFRTLNSLVKEDEQ